MELDKDTLLELYPTYDSVYGPYTRKDGRKHVVLYNSSIPSGQKGRTKTISFPKAIIESNIGECLLPEETIDHKDRDFNNNSPENLVIKERSYHSSEDALRVYVEPLPCSWCGKVFTPTRGQINTRAESTAGPFCSRHCSGSYSASVQNGGETIERKQINKVYFSPEK